MTAQTPEGEHDPARSPCALIDPDLYEQLVRRIIREDDLPRPAAEKAMDEGRVWAFRRWRMVTPLAATHTACDAVLTVLAL